MRGAATDGVLSLNNNAETGFTTLNLGPTTGNTASGTWSLSKSTCTINAAAGATISCAGASFTPAIPIGALLFGVTTRVTTAFGATGGLTSITIGDGTTANAFSTTSAITLNASTNGANFVTTWTPRMYGGTAPQVVVTAVGGTSASNPPFDQFTFIPAPTVTNVKPKSGPTAGGTVVTITGANFNTVTNVMFGATAASSFVLNSDTQITATAPAEVAGVVTISLVTSDPNMYWAGVVATFK